jgi:hypothetical protein
VSITLPLAQGIISLRCDQPVGAGRCFEVVRGANESINVKRLPKKPAPPRFGRKLTAKQQELATHICVDCECQPSVTRGSNIILTGVSI